MPNKSNQQKEDIKEMQKQTKNFEFGVILISYLFTTVQSPKPLKSLGSGRKPLNLELEDKMFC